MLYKKYGSVFLLKIKEDISKIGKIEDWIRNQRQILNKNMST